jgi:hypothetical protein
MDKNIENKYLNKKVTTDYGSGTIYKISEPSSAEADKTPNLHLKLDKPTKGKLIKDVDVQIIKPKDVKEILEGYTGKKLKNVKMFEEFTADMSNNGPDVPDHYVLTDGRFLFCQPQPFKDMAGEINYFYKYFVGKPEDDWEKAKEIKYAEVENLLSPADKKQHEAEREDMQDSNAERSKKWVE